MDSYSKDFDKNQNGVEGKNKGKPYFVPDEDNDNSGCVYSYNEYTKKDEVVGFIIKEKKKR